MNNLIDGKKEGFWEMWLDDDVIDFRGFYIDDKEEGYFEYSEEGPEINEEFWHNKNNITWKGDCKNGKEIGLWECFYKGELIKKVYKL